MRKIIIFIILLLGVSNICYGESWDILYVKYMHTPVLNSPWEDNSVVMCNLQKWYIVLDQWENWDYINVKLTDNNKWYVLKVLLENNNLNKDKIWGNYWKVIKSTFLSEKPVKWNKTNNLIYEWTIFKILHVNYINNNYIKVKITNWKYKNKVWFIDKQYAKVYNVDWFKNDISTFIESNSNNTKTTTKKTTVKSTKKVEVELNSAKKEPVNPVTKTVKEDELDDSDDFINSLNDILNEKETTTTTNTNNNQTTNNTTTTNNNSDDSDDFINSLNDILNEPDTQSTNTTSTSSNTQNTQTTNNNTTTTSSTTNTSTETPSVEEIDDFINSLNSLFE